MSIERSLKQSLFAPDRSLEVLLASNFRIRNLQCVSCACYTTRRVACESSEQTLLNKRIFLRF